ncbi:hypothetical protein BD626DRAFT_477809 [Schizophyllum amplum]|uniref:Malic enzyme n=1 Tax=Schizophyllum amplum TaxID=97359 RepID=A0A550D0I2_9AGAR|nr:hypothetical protein BD626DRAFT_477809 [Auriculariopsis ampla]
MSDKPVFRVALRGDALLTSPRWNKGTAFTAEERKAFGLIGRLPYRVNTIDEQVERAFDQLSGRSDIGKNSFLQSMKAQNWVLYYELIGRHLHELVPIIYTPTEAEAISQYSHLFRRSEGLYIAFPHRESMEEDFLEQVEDRDIDLIVCSDAEAILGIGDQGAPATVSQLVLSSLIGGIDPSKCLAVTLDVGTNNPDLLNDKLYVGWPQKRVRGQEYDDFIDKFVQLVRKYRPHCLLHFEDFGVTNAQRLLRRYRDTHAVFNDDIQGTGAVTLATLMAAIGVTKRKLSDQVIVVYGAGSAGLGIARQLRDAMATSRFYLLDRFGLIRTGLGDKMREDQRDFARKEEEWGADAQAEVGLLDVVKRAHPTVLIGTSTHAGAFTRDAIEAMAEKVDRPIIFPLSNPSKLVEVHPHDANEWTRGKALLATGQSVPAREDAKWETSPNATTPSSTPGLGFGAMLCQSRRMTDTMIIAGAQRLAELSPALQDPDDSLLPDFGDAPDVNFEVGVAVAEQAIEEGTAGVDWKKEDVRGRAQEKRWKPIYGEYVYDPEGEM